MNEALPVVAALGGAVAGSLLTTVLSHISSAKRELRHDRLDVLIALMRGRNDIFADGVAQEVNTIPILFNDQPGVRHAYQHFCAVPNGPSADLHRRYDDMVLAVAKSLNFRHWSVADIDLGYYPSPPLGRSLLRSAAATAIPTIPGAGEPSSDSRP